MAKQSGLGDNFYFAGRDLSGDIGSLGSISGGNAPLEVTAINKSAYERLGGLRTGTIEFTSFFNPSSNQAHQVLGGLSTATRHVMYCRGTTIGDPAACMQAKQVNYDPTRAADGSLTLATQCLADTYGLEWGRLLTAGLRTDTAATNGASIDTTASLSFGGQAYLQLSAFTGTDVTVKIQDSADDSSFSDVASFAFSQVTAAVSQQRIALTNTATIRRYIRAITVTTGGFTSATFAVVVVKNEIAAQVF